MTTSPCGSSDFQTLLTFPQPPPLVFNAHIYFAPFHRISCLLKLPFLKRYILSVLVIGPPQQLCEIRWLEVEWIGSKQVFLQVRKGGGPLWLPKKTLVGLAYRKAMWGGGIVRTIVSRSTQNPIRVYPAGVTPRKVSLGLYCKHGWVKQPAGSNSMTAMKLPV